MSLDVSSLHAREDGLSLGQSIHLRRACCLIALPNWCDAMSLDVSSLHAREDGLSLGQSIHLRRACCLPRIKILKDVVAAAMEVCKCGGEALENLHCVGEVRLRHVQGHLGLGACLRHVCD